MKSINLTEQEIEDINEAVSSPETKRRFLRKLLAIKMVASDLKREEICSTLDITRTTLSAYVEQYNIGGLAATLEDRSYKPTSCLDGRFEEIAERFKKDPPASAKQAVSVIEQITGVRLSASQVRSLMAKKLGMRFRKAGTLPGKADPQMQMDFFSRELEPRLEQAREGDRHLYFMDASHFLWGSFADYCWCFERVWVRSASGRKRFNALGAVNAITKEMLCNYTEGSVNSETVCSMLIDINNAHPYGEISVVLDNVPYQHARIVKAMAAILDIELVYLPPYSPNLNLIERAWKHVKKSALSNRHYETYESFKMAITNCIEAINSTMKEEMQSLLSLKFQMFSQ
jgi:transposase